MENVNVIVHPPESLQITVSPVAIPASSSVRVLDFENVLEVTINHGFGRNPIIQIYDTLGNLILVQVQKINNNTHKAIFNQNLSGTIIYQ